MEENHEQGRDAPELDVPGAFEQVQGDSRNGREVYDKWVRLLVESEPLSHNGPICLEVERLGFRGVAQDLAHLIALGRHLTNVFSSVQGEMERHFEDEIEEMYSKVGLESGPALDQFFEDIPPTSQGN